MFRVNITDEQKKTAREQDKLILEAMFPKGEPFMDPDIENTTIIELAPKTLRGEILNSARLLTEGDRNDAYGDPYNNMLKTAKMVGAYLGIDLRPDQMAHVMQLMKIARTDMPGYRRDNYDDNCAYGGIAGECREKWENRAIGGYVSNAP